MAKKGFQNTTEFKRAMDQYVKHYKNAERYGAIQLREDTPLDLNKRAKNLFPIPARKSSDSVVDLYRNAFKFIFHDDVLFKIQDAEQYDEMLLLIKLTHGLPVELENPNPVIARLDRIKKKMNSKNGVSVDFDSRYSTVWIASGQEPDNMTIYKFNELFHRFSAIKNHDMSVLFKTVDVSGKVEISEWFEDKFKDTTNYVDLDQMKNKTF